MIRTTSTPVTKKLALQFILENIDYKKRCRYLQEVISIGRVNDVWRKALLVFFDTPFINNPARTFCKN
ncbi:MAG: hypothetical protein JNN00_17870 [Chitinophagaceae bacterium]|nr:hypothetical protein [Chitinophagaceae bacterium]